ncbi:MAG: ABC transporter substrate-binding protein, partial [Mesorhizobium sp.]
FVDLYLDLARGQQVLSTDEIIARYRQGSKA